MTQNNQSSILIVDDTPNNLKVLHGLLVKHGYDVRAARDGKMALNVVTTMQPDLILLDMNYRKGDTSGQEGMQWLRKIMELQPEASVIMITAYADVSTAVDAVKAGATDFIEKPWRNEKLLANLKAALERREQQKEAASRKAEAPADQVASAPEPQQFGEIIGQSAPMQRVFDLIDKVAYTDANVLILGENGTGKELVARAIHQRSLRHENVFISVDMGAITETLFESELFGHVKGAYTGAAAAREGRFSLADKGTIFLDEIGELPLDLQAKLLRVLQQGEFEPLGSSTTIKVDVRVIAATNRDLQKEVEKGNFREDLFYRLNVFPIVIPPLRQRGDDTILIAEAFIQKYAKRSGKAIFPLSTSAVFKRVSSSVPSSRIVKSAVKLVSNTLSKPS